MKKLYVATVRIAVNAKTCGNTVAGACEWFSGLLSDNNDVFDWAYGSRKGVYPYPKLVEVDEKKYEEGDLFSK
jgi:predicted neuraminidase